MRIRAIKPEDSVDIFNWRNNKLTREMFFDDSNLTFSNHQKWFKEAIDNLFIDFYIGENQTEKVGVVRFDLDTEKNISDISININPDFRNKGFGKNLLLSSIVEYSKKRNCNLRAKIKNKNDVSLKLFSNVGFKIIENNSKFTVLEYKKEIQFKKVDYDCVEILYNLLKERNHFISHRKMPSFEEHVNFINTNPYIQWYVFSLKDKYIGSFYIKSDNSIAINISNPNNKMVLEVINFINQNFKPQKEIPSQVPYYFYINVSETNNLMKSILNSMGLLPIQISFKLS